ncbi:MAG: hypothetical protein IR164_15390 [Devosia sp.]|uniref:hypothetical protein n=1 Tax=Devosia sp. TaxID=1871048 RepID=UPI001A0545CE|nr:hypothetical protein [Devosia sp.]MBF0680309.1 hypothetical protein [Devosia sp.]
MSALRSEVLPAIQLPHPIKRTRVAAATMLASAVFASGSVADTLPSGMDGLVVVELTRLPPAPQPVEPALCDHLLVEPRTAGGAKAKALGWAVTGEVSLKGFDVVSFVGGVEPGTSGSCQTSDGNVALFDGEQLHWLVYGEKGAGARIGSVQSFENAAIRIWDGEFLPQPIADLHVDKGGAISLVALADVEQFCDGQAAVPNIYGMPIASAREELASAGWGPILGIHPGEPADTRAEALKASGIYEVQSCSPTGFGSCSFRYSGQFAELSVVTVGEGAGLSTPAVARYDVACAIPGVG